MAKKNDTYNKVCTYFQDNYQDTILLNHLYILSTTQRINTNYKILIQKLLDEDEEKVFKRYLSRNQLIRFTERFVESTEKPNKILSNKLIKAVEICDTDDLQCRVNAFQLLGANGRANNYDFINELNQSFNGFHMTLRFSFLNISVYCAKKPFDKVHEIFTILDSDKKLRKFYFSYLRYYYKGIGNVFKNFIHSVDEDKVQRLAVLIPAVWTILKQKRYQDEIIENAHKISHVFPKATTRAPNELISKINKVMEDKYDISFSAR